MDLSGLYRQLGRLLEQRSEIEDELQIFSVDAGKMTGCRRDSIRRLERDFKIIEREISAINKRIEEMEETRNTKRNNNNRTN